jgi:CRP-like cAMP-binding protein
LTFSIPDTLPLFSNLTPACRQRLSRALLARDIPEGQTLIIEGEETNACYFIHSGTFRVLRINPEGKIQVLSRLSDGDPVNVISLLMPERINRASVEALTPASVFVLAAQDFDALLTGCPDFSTVLLRHFAKRISHLTDLAADLSLLTVRARLARFLITLADGPENACDWTQDEIAAQLGTVRDVVGRILRDFESQGLIRRSRQHIILLDRAALFREAALG